MTIKLPKSYVDKTKVNDSGLTALIQNLARDCSPTQFLREFVANSIEACLKVPQEHEKRIIVTKISVPCAEHENVDKLCIIDSGVGMSLAEMKKWLNQLSSSGPTTGPYRKYGVGAKISALTRNHAGIEYRSWQVKNGVISGNRIVIGYDSTSDTYGILGYPNPEDPDEILYHQELQESDRHSLEVEHMPNGHGTMVILHGMKPTDITSNKPADVKLFGGNSNETWLINYFHQRYFLQFPEIDFRILNNQPERQYLKPFRGQFNVLSASKRSSHSGTMSVGNDITQSNATLYWWLLNEKVDDKGRYFTKGHTALINENEIFDIEDARGKRLSEFGIYIAKNRVVIYVEPHQNVTQNTARTQLLQKDGNSILSWEIWQQDFKSNMPAVIVQFLKDQINAVKLNKEDSNIQDKLEPYKDLYNMKNFSKTIKKPLVENPNGKEVLYTPQTGSSTTGSSTTGSSTTGNPITSTAQTSQTPATSQPTAQSKITQKPYFPQHIWLSAEEFLKESEAPDRAASYDEDERLLKINRDYKVFADMLTFFKQKYDLTDEMLAMIASEIENLFAMALLEAVVSIESMPTKTWTPSAISAALSPDSLTIAVLSRHLIVNEINQFVAGKFKLKANPA